MNGLQEDKVVRVLNAFELTHRASRLVALRALYSVVHRLSEIGFNDLSNLPIVSLHDFMSGEFQRLGLNRLVVIEGGKSRPTWPAPRWILRREREARQARIVFDQPIANSNDPRCTKTAPRHHVRRIQGAAVERAKEKRRG